MGPTVEQLTGEEHKVLSRVTVHFKGQGRFISWIPTAQGAAFPVVGWFLNWFSVLVFFFNSLLVSKFLEAGRVGRQDSLQFLLRGQLFNPEVKQVFLAAPLHSFP